MSQHACMKRLLSDTSLMHVPHHMEVLEASWNLYGLSHTAASQSSFQAVTNEDSQAPFQVAV